MWGVLYPLEHKNVTPIFSGGWLSYCCLQAKEEHTTSPPRGLCDLTRGLSNFFGGLGISLLFINKCYCLLREPNVCNVGGPITRWAPWLSTL